MGESCIEMRGGFLVCIEVREFSFNVSSGVTRYWECGVTGY